MILVDNILKITDLGLAFRLQSNRDVRRSLVRGTLGNFFFFSSITARRIDILCISRQITWHLKYFFIELASNQIFGQPESSCTKWLTDVHLTTVSLIEQQKSLQLNREYRFRIHHYQTITLSNVFNRVSNLIHSVDPAQLDYSFTHSVDIDRHALLNSFFFQCSYVLCSLV